MTGLSVAEVRRQLGLTAEELARLLIVHPSSVHRWEHAGSRSARVEGLARVILWALWVRTGSGPGMKLARIVGQRIQAALMEQGNLAALGAAISFIQEIDRDTERTQSAPRPR